ncbi:UNVERIFIED_CONTAM: hypothetical protein Slati_2050300 [Sesamum latifolium]|uniref:Uncharacterized protein n=1 Tax=Sesamum latifolium TaxID=2727402 RepID=A0AAW2WTN6_9LAMI
MTTVEKLLVQIFERKNSIIEQVKQQTELYNQHLVSKLLIDGISPPSWLWNPSASSDSKELNKEELISKLLHPYPQPSVRCSVAHYPAYNNLVFTGANKEFSDGVFMGHMAFDKGPSRQDDLSVPALTSEDHGLCALNYPEPDASVTSPEDQTDGRISNIYNAPDQSLVGIQRSKSRQKALVLRNSANQQTKSSLSHENISNGFSSQIRFSLSAANQMGQKDELAKSPEPGPVGRQSCKDVDLDEADCEKKEKGTGARITRSGSYTEVPFSVSGSLTLGRSSEDCKEDASSAAAKERRKGSTSVCDPEEADNSVDKLPKSAGQSIYCQRGGDRQLDGADCVSNDKETNVYSGRITRSKISGKRQNYACNSSKAESDAYQKIDIAMMDSQDQPSNYVDGSLTRFSPCNILNEGFEARESISGDSKSRKEKGAVASWSSSQHKTCVDNISGLDMHAHSAMVDGGIAPSSGGSALEVNDSGEVLGLVRHSVGLFRRVTRSQTRADDQEATKPVISFENPSFGGTMSKSGRKQKSAAKNELYKASSGQSVSTCHGTNDMLDQCGNAALLMPSELVLHDNVDQSGTSSSNDAKQRRDVESQVGVPSDSFVFVEPKHLSLREIEDYPLKRFTPDSEVRMLDRSPEKLGYSVSDAAISLDKGISGDVNLLLSGKKSSEKPHVSGKAEEVQRDSLESDFQENPDTRDEKNGTIVSDYPKSKSSKDNKDAGLNCKISGVQQEAILTRSKMVDMPELRIHPVKFHLEDGHESFPEPHIEEGNLSAEGKDKSPWMANAPEMENLRPSVCLNSVKEPRAESSDCLIEKVQMSNPSCVVLDKRKQLLVQESQILSCLEGEVSGQHADTPGADNGFVACSTIRSPRCENLSLERRFRHASMESWPQPKRRKD